MYDEDFEEEFEEDFEKDSEAERNSEESFEEDFEEDAGTEPAPEPEEGARLSVPHRAQEPQLLAIIQGDDETAPNLGAAIPSPRGAAAADIVSRFPQEMDSPTGAVNEPSPSAPQEPQPKQPKPPDLVKGSGKAPQAVAQAGEGPAIETTAAAPERLTMADSQAVVPEPSEAWTGRTNGEHKSTRQQRALAAGQKQEKYAKDTPVTAKAVDHKVRKQVGLEKQPATAEEVRGAEKPASGKEAAKRVQARKGVKAPKKGPRTGPKDQLVEEGGGREQEDGMKAQQLSKRQEAEARQQPTPGGDPMILRIEGDRLRFDVGEALRRIRIAWDKHKEFQAYMQDRYRLHDLGANGRGDPRLTHPPRPLSATERVDRALQRGAVELGESGPSPSQPPRWASPGHRQRPKSACVGRDTRSTAHAAKQRRKRPMSAIERAARSAVSEVYVDFVTHAPPPSPSRSPLLRGGQGRAKGDGRLAKHGERNASTLYRRANGHLSPLRRLELQTEALLSSCGVRVLKPSSSRRHRPESDTSPRLGHTAVKRHDPEGTHQPCHTEPRQRDGEKAHSAPVTVGPKPEQHHEASQTPGPLCPAAFSFPSAFSSSSAPSPPTERRAPRAVEGLRALVSLSEVDVGYLLSSLGFQRYIASFLAVGVSGQDLARCSEEDLNDCGVHFRPHRARLHSMIRTLLATHVPTAMLLPGSPGYDFPKLSSPVAPVSTQWEVGPISGTAPPPMSSHEPPTPLNPPLLIKPPSPVSVASPRSVDASPRSRDSSPRMTPPPEPPILFTTLTLATPRPQDNISNDIKDNKENREEEEEEEKAWRGYESRRGVGQCREAATTIQRLWRGHAARRGLGMGGQGQQRSHWRARQEGPIPAPRFSSSTVVYCNYDGDEEEMDEAAFDAHFNAASAYAPPLSSHPLDLPSDHASDSSDGRGMGPPGSFGEDVGSRSYGYDDPPGLEDGLELGAAEEEELQQRRLGSSVRTLVLLPSIIELPFGEDEGDEDERMQALRDRHGNGNNGNNGRGDQSDTSLASSERTVGSRTSSPDSIESQEEEGEGVEDKSALAVQRLFRGFKARASLQRKRVAAAQIQGLMRVRVARGHKDKLAQQKRMQQEEAKSEATFRRSFTAEVPKDDKVLLLQKAWRGHRGRKEAQSFKARKRLEEERSRHREEDEEKRALHDNASALQKAWRGHKGRQSTRDLRHRRREEVEEEQRRKEASSLLLQKAWRGHRGRQEVKGIRGQGAHGRGRAEEEDEEKQELASIGEGYEGDEQWEDVEEGEEEQEENGKREAEREIKRREMEQARLREEEEARLREAARVREEEERKQEERRRQEEEELRAAQAAEEQRLREVEQRRRDEEEEKRRREAEEEEERRRQEARVREQEEMRRREEEEARQAAEQEEAKQRAAEAQRQREAEERRRQEEEEQQAKQRAAQAAEEERLREIEQRRREEEEKRRAEEEEARQKAAQQQRRKEEEEEKARKAAEEERLRLAEETRRREEAEVQRRKAAEEQRLREAEAQRLRAAEEVKRKRQAEEEEERRRGAKAVEFQRVWRGHAARAQVAPRKAAAQQAKAQATQAGAMILEGQDGHKRQEAGKDPEVGQPQPSQWTLVEELGGGWAQYVDNGDQSVFFLNADTGQLTMDHPFPATSNQGGKKGNQPAEGSSAKPKNAATQQQPSPKNAPEREAASEEWQAFVDPATGRRYLTNATTGESKWDDEEAGTVEAGSEQYYSAAKQATEDEWDQFVDPTSGVPYLVNRRTGESVWAQQAPAPAPVTVASWQPPPWTQAATIQRAASWSPASPTHQNNNKPAASPIVGLHQPLYSDLNEDYEEDF